jgi:uncharacterized membrane protein
VADQVVHELGGTGIEPAPGVAGVGRRLVAGGQGLQAAEIGLEPAVLEPECQKRATTAGLDPAQPREELGLLLAHVVVEYLGQFVQHAGEAEGHVGVALMTAFDLLGQAGELGQLLAVDHVVAGEDVADQWLELVRPGRFGGRRQIIEGSLDGVDIGVVGCRHLLQGLLEHTAEVEAKPTEHSRCPRPGRRELDDGPRRRSVSIAHPHSPLGQPACRPPLTSLAVDTARRIADVLNPNWKWSGDAPHLFGRVERRTENLCPGLPAMTGGWAHYLGVFAIFVLAHVLPTRPPIRGRLVALLGERVYLWAYSAVSIGLLYWLILAAGRAPALVLWGFAAWQAWVPNLVMPVVVLLAVGGIGVANPFSFGGDSKAVFDPARPGITAVSRHPLLLAIALWALAHLVPNGTAAHVLLFGLFAAFAVFGMVMLDRRRQRQWGEARFAELARNTSLWPGEAWWRGRAGRALDTLPPQRLAIAAVVYLGLLLLHPLLFGVSPVPQF